MACSRVFLACSTREARSSSSLTVTSLPGSAARSRIVVRSSMAVPVSSSRFAPSRSLVASPTAFASDSRASASCLMARALLAADTSVFVSLLALPARFFNDPASLMDSRAAGSSSILALSEIRLSRRLHAFASARSDALWALANRVAIVLVSRSTACACSAPWRADAVTAPAAITPTSATAVTTASTVSTIRTAWPARAGSSASISVPNPGIASWCMSSRSSDGDVSSDAGRGIACAPGGGGAVTSPPAPGPEACGGTILSSSWGRSGSWPVSVPSSPAAGVGEGVSSGSESRRRIQSSPVSAGESSCSNRSGMVMGACLPSGRSSRVSWP